MLREDLATERIDLDLPRDRTEASPFEAEFEPSDAAKQRPDRHPVTKRLSIPGSS